MSAIECHRKEVAMEHRNLKNEMASFRCSNKTKVSFYFIKFVFVGKGLKKP